MKPGHYDERFDALGSWIFFFGISAVLCTLACWLAVSLFERSRGRPAPSPQLRVMWLPGSCAGICWSIANITITYAVLLGGNALTTAESATFSLVTSGAWGLFWYREIRGRAAVAWVGAAIFTAGMTVLLSFEKG